MRKTVDQTVHCRSHCHHQTHRQNTKNELRMDCPAGYNPTVAAVAAAALVPPCMRRYRILEREQSAGRGLWEDYLLGLK